MHTELTEEELPRIDHGVDVIGDEWDDNEIVGMTSYRYRDLPAWARRGLKKPQKNNNELR